MLASQESLDGKRLDKTPLPRYGSNCPLGPLFTSVVTDRRDTHESLAQFSFPIASLQYVPACATQLPGEAPDPHPRVSPLLLGGKVTHRKRCHYTTLVEGVDFLSWLRSTWPKRRGPLLVSNHQPCRRWSRGIIFVSPILARCLAVGSHVKTSATHVLVLGRCASVEGVQWEGGQGWPEEG
jgi:hypothetical protein